MQDNLECVHTLPSSYGSVGHGRTQDEYGQIYLHGNTFYDTVKLKMRLP